MSAERARALLLAAAVCAAVPALAQEVPGDGPARRPDAATRRSAVPHPPTLIRAGDRVRVTARINGVEAVVIAIAEQSGVAQQIIRVVNPDSRRAIRARVVAAGEVEVVNAR